MHKHVTVEFTLEPPHQPEAVHRPGASTRARGSIPEAVANPLDPENILKSSGRGIFFMRNFMDDVLDRARPRAAAWSVRMSKNLAS